MIERLWHQLGAKRNGGGGRVVNYRINHYDPRTFLFVSTSGFPGSSNKPLGSLCSSKMANNWVQMPLKLHYCSMVVNTQAIALL